MRSDDAVPWYYKPATVLALLFVVVGPFALPLLWFSPAFGRASKIILTIVELIYTAFILYAIGVIVMQYYRLFEQLMTPY